MEPPACEYILFTATPSEREAVKTVADELGLSYAPASASLGRYVDLGPVGHSRVLAVETQMGPFSTRGSAAQALQWRAGTQARAIIGVGMAFGTRPDVQNLGDVLVATGLVAYDYRTIRCGEAETPAFDYQDAVVHRAREQLVNLFKRAAAQPNPQVTVHHGLFLSGGARIHCDTYRDDLVRQLAHCGLAIGGDMEGVGLLAISDNTESRWAVVKGISDFADHRRNEVIESTRPAACYNSIRFVLSTLENEEALRAPV